MKFFSREELLRRISVIGNTLPEKIVVYMIGGCAMVLLGWKEVTKDVDWIIDSSKDMRTLINTLRIIGFEEIISPAQEYMKLGAGAIMRDKNGFQCDLFLKKVCNALRLSDRMKERAMLYGDFGNLTIYLASKEDIFLFKGMTERERDLEDMLALLRTGIDHETLIKECKKQRSENAVWESFLVEKLGELEEKYRISIPWKKKLVRTAEDAVIETILIRKIKDGYNTVKKLASSIRYSQSWIRKELSSLERKGKIQVDRSKKPFKYRV